MRLIFDENDVLIAVSGTLSSYLKSLGPLFHEEAGTPLYKQRPQGGLVPRPVEEYTQDESYIKWNQRKSALTFWMNLDMDDVENYLSSVDYTDINNLKLDMGRIVKAILIMRDYILK